MKVEDSRQSELEGLGIDADAAAAWLAQQEAENEAACSDQTFVVWPQNWRTVLLFLKLQTQWRRLPDGALDGLRWEAVDLALRRARPPLEEQDLVFDQLIAMEHAAVEASDD